jgi:hypothetical protein
MIIARAKRGGDALSFVLLLGGDRRPISFFFCMGKKEGSSAISHCGGLIF